MSPFWQAKIWGLLHDPALKALYDNTGRGREGAWQRLACMEGWVSPKAKSLKEANFSRQWLKHIGLCDLIASASDRAAIGRLPPTTTINYDTQGLEIRHLLSGANQQYQLTQWHDRLMSLGNGRTDFLIKLERSLIPESIRTETDARKVFWWLWRCYPQILSRPSLDTSQNLPDEPGLPLLPAETRIPDASVWSHTTMTSALAGSLAGYHTEPTAYPKKGARKGKDYQESRPYVATFSFTPVQDLIKASRKMRDFWAGSWLLHYLSAKLSWAIACKYGPDSLLYPCLYEQPLIDLWLLEKYPDFDKWIAKPSARRLLTAGFPNVLVLILPNNGASQTDEQVKNPVTAAMQQIEETLLTEWRQLGNRVLENLQSGRVPWMPDINQHTWDDWLKTQWQTYWVALPMGDRQSKLHQSPRQEKQYSDWQKQQNEFARPKDDLFVESESEFLKATYESALKEDWSARQSSETRYKVKQPNLNVGSWWASIFDQTRLALNAVKNVRTWQLPTAFGPRSTVSGIGPVVHPGGDWITEREVADLWENHAGLFDGIEKLNATEVLKRGLRRILPRVLSSNQGDLDLYYPDLSSGVAGWLRKIQEQGNTEAIAYFVQVCQEIEDRFPWTHQNNDSPANEPWGIPWVVNHPNDSFQYNPRLLNAGWLIEDFEPSNPDTNKPLTRSQKQELTKEELHKLREFIAQRFPPGNNPTDWYVLAAGDGDGMGSWLKGEQLQSYSQYTASALDGKINSLPEKLQPIFREFLEENKRMGPATHSALSRALLDFSNQLVPYITEERYAGRLIYGGGDDVLAYTNLWEWDSWLWDIRQCFKGADDPCNKFTSEGDYWQWKDSSELPKNLSARPLFTMGSLATISFGIVIAHHSVPLAIALENLWEAQEEAKDHESPHESPQDNKKKKAVKDAVQVRILYGNGNILKATSKFDVFREWKTLLDDSRELENAIFEQAVQIWNQHPAPFEAIAPWTQAFCTRRDIFHGNDDIKDRFQQELQTFLHDLCQTTQEKDRENEVASWLKVAAFLLRNRNINLGGNI